MIKKFNLIEDKATQKNKIPQKNKIRKPRTKSFYNYRDSSVITKQYLINLQKLRKLNTNF